MSIEIRPVTEEELPALLEVALYVFASSPSERERLRREQREGLGLRPEWTLAAFVDGRIATASACGPPAWSCHPSAITSSARTITQPTRGFGAG